MSKKKKSASAKSASDTISLRYKNQAQSIISGIFKLDPANHIVVSLVKSELDGVKKNIVTRWNFMIRRDNRGIFELPGGLSATAFTDKFGTALRNSDKSDLRYNLLVAFFDVPPTGTGHTRLDTPDSVFQWVLEDKTIRPENDTEDAWNGVTCLAGPAYVNGHFAEDENESEELFDDALIASAGDLVSTFFDTVAREAPQGMHRLETDTSIYPDPAVILFHKSADGVLSIEGNADDSLSMMTAALVREGTFSTKLTSFLGEQTGDGNTLMRDESPQEIRAWAGSPGDIYALSEKQAQDAYCRDFITGTLHDIPENISYHAAWKILP